jgi:hypothetical protein
MDFTDVAKGREDRLGPPFKFFWRTACLAVAFAKAEASPPCLSILPISTQARSLCYFKGILLPLQRDPAGVATAMTSLLIPVDSFPAIDIASR